MLRRLAKTAAISASLRRMVEKKAGILGKIFKIGLNNPGKTALGVGAGMATSSAYKENKRGFKPGMSEELAGQTVPPPGAQ